ncbi:hypothetical protein Bbelb_077930 [Branchiostoma belcheri]|nr:hypothetical protein Bbelb_077930 [Branchiostoma belcheri]
MEFSTLNIVLLAVLAACSLTEGAVRTIRSRGDTVPPGHTGSSQTDGSSVSTGTDADGNCVYSFHVPIDAINLRPCPDTRSPQHRETDGSSVSTGTDADGNCVYSFHVPIDAVNLRPCPDTRSTQNREVSLGVLTRSATDGSSVSTGTDADGNCVYSFHVPIDAINLRPCPDSTDSQAMAQLRADMAAQATAANSRITDLAAQVELLQESLAAQQRHIEVLQRTAEMQASSSPNHVPGVLRPYQTEGDESDSMARNKEHGDGLEEKHIYDNDRNVGSPFSETEDAKTEAIGRNKGVNNEGIEEDHIYCNDTHIVGPTGNQTRQNSTYAPRRGGPTGNQTTQNSTYVPRSGGPTGNQTTQNSTIYAPRRGLTGNQTRQNSTYVPGVHQPDEETEGGKLESIARNKGVNTEGIKEDHIYCNDTHIGGPTGNQTTQNSTYVPGVQQQDEETEGGKVEPIARNKGVNNEGIKEDHIYCNDTHIGGLTDNQTTQNSTYVPGVHRQGKDGDDQRTITRCVVMLCQCRSYLLRVLVVAVAVSALCGAGAVLNTHLTGTYNTTGEINPDQYDATVANSTTFPELNVDLSSAAITWAFVATTGLQGEASKLPGVTTTITKLPEATTTLTEVTTTLPKVTTTLPEVTTTIPEVTTTLPKVTTTIPEVTTTLPEVTTTIPEVTTTLPKITTALPTKKEDCHFPFTYEGKTYYSCTNADHDAPWCSLTAVYQPGGRWKYCGVASVDAPSDLLYYGCFSETMARKFPHAFMESQALTNPMCVEHCKVAGYPYAATQYASQCYCGTERDLGELHERRPESLCYMQCSGDSSSVCGGNRRMSVFGTKGLDLTCPVGYRLLVGTCIRRSYDEKTHNDAEKACLEEGATLVMPKTRELDLALRNVVSMEGYKLNHWIGLTIEMESWTAEYRQTSGYMCNVLVGFCWSSSVGR